MAADTTNRKSERQNEMAVETGNVSVLEKVFDLLDVLGEGADMSAAELADRIEQPRSSVYRLLTSLRRRGWVEPGADRATFRLGLEFLRFGGVVLGRFDVRHAARPVLERIHGETGETVYLCVRSQDTAVCIDRIDGMFVDRTILFIGGSLPLHVGGASRLLLAFEPESEWHRYVESGELVKYTSNTETSPKKVLASLAAAREDGFAITDEEIVLGLGACSTPVFDHTGHIAATIAIGGMRQTILVEKREEIIGLMKDAAREVSVAMGYGIQFGNADAPPTNGAARTSRR